MTRRAASLLAFLAGTFIVSAACGRERPGDALLAQALQQHARIAATLQRDLLSTAEKAAGPDRFDAYWTYNLAVGTWRQVDELRTLLGRTLAAAAPATEQPLRAALRDQAAFAAWEVEQGIGMLDDRHKRPGTAQAMRIGRRLYDWLRQVRSAIGRYNGAASGSKTVTSTPSGSTRLAARALPR